MTMDDFQRDRNASLTKFETTEDPRGGKHGDKYYLYYPDPNFGWSYPVSIRNVVKQWDSIEHAWHHMEIEASRLGRTC